MPDAATIGEKPDLVREFPAVPTSAWEAAIARDLKGADYEKKLVWRTEEGIVIRPYYRKENLAGLENQLTRRRQSRGWEIAPELEPDEKAIRADLLHEAGAHCIQELGYAIAAGVERLAELAATQSIDAAAGAIEFVFAAGTSYFMEIAKLRAARLLWAQIVSEFGACCRRRSTASFARRFSGSQA